MVLKLLLTVTSQSPAIPQHVPMFPVVLAHSMATHSMADLPQDALLSLLTHVAAAANTGQLLKLALVSRQHLERIAHADWFWQQQSEALGWIRPGIRHPPRAERPKPAHQQHAPVPGSSCCALPAGSKQQLSGAAAAEAGRRTSNGTRASSRLWFEYYCLRMNCRWRLRLLVRKYLPFLNSQSRLAMQAGASVQQLEAAEAALGIKLPWELWELYRFRAGQAPGVGVCFADSCRCLGVHELCVATLPLSDQPSLAPERPPTQQQQLAAVQAQLPGLCCHASRTQPAASLQPVQVLDAAEGEAAGGSSIVHSNQADTVRAAAAAAAAAVALVEGGGGDVCGVVFLSNTMGSVEYAITAHDSAVYLKRGFTTRRVASSLTGFVQHLLA